MFLCNFKQRSIIVSRVMRGVDEIVTKWLRHILIDLATSRIPNVHTIGIQKGS